MAERFEVDLVTSTGVVLPSLVASSGQRYVVAEPAQECIRVRGRTSGLNTYRLMAHLDGERTGASFIVTGRHKDQEYNFKGWLHYDGGKGGSFYRAFKFGLCTPSSDATLATCLADIKAGRVEVQVERVVPTGRQVRCVPMVAGPSNAATSKKLPDNKKKFLAPSLKGEAGSTLKVDLGSLKAEYRTVGQLAPLVLRYDSMEALLMRKILDPKLPSHRDILRNSSNPSMRAAVGTETAAAATAAATATAATAAAAAAAAPGSAGASGGGCRRVKRERPHAGVKREREQAYEDGQDIVPRSATADKIDLTEEPTKPLMVNGRTLRPDELAVCDLADSDDDEEGPKWGVQKKQQIDFTSAV